MISRIAKRSKKTLVVLNTNSAVPMPWIDEVDAVLEAWYGGQQIGLALERLLFGDISPSGKLPLTFPKTLDDALQITSDLKVQYDEGLEVGYKWFDANEVEPLFAFGHGLTYSTFELGDLDVQLDDASSSVRCTTKLMNTGPVDAKQVVQIYVSYPEEVKEPPKLLKGFEKVLLQAGESLDVVLEIELENLQIWTEESGWHLVYGEYTFVAGFSAADIRTKTALIL